MEVILSQDVENLGRVGDVVKVKDGFARNYLIPNKLACFATKGNLKQIEKQAEQRRAKYEQEKKTAQELADKLSKVSCTVSVEVNDQEKLYGAVSESEIVRAVAIEGFEIDKKDLVIEKSLDELGIFEVGISVHPEVTAKIKVWVTKK